MLVILFTMLFGGDSTTGMLDFIADTQDQVEVVMDRGDRLDDALATLEEMETRIVARNSVVEENQDDLESVLGESDVSDADIDTIWYRYYAEREAYNNDMINLRFQLKDQLTREEWEQIFTED